jgi:hypothetical protein
MLGQGWEDVSTTESNDGGLIQNHEGFGIIPRCVASLFEGFEKRSPNLNHLTSKLVRFLFFSFSACNI